MTSKATSKTTGSRASKKTAASKRGAEIGKQYDAALLGAAEETTTRTTTTRPVISRPASVRNGGANTAVSRPVLPETVKRSSPAPLVASKPKVVATSCTTTVESPVNALGVEERLTALGYEALALFVYDKRVEAAYVVSPLGEKVLVRTASRPKVAETGVPLIHMEPADDAVVGPDVSDFFAQRLITEAGLGQRIDTDFAVITPDGVSVWLDDATVGSHWLYASDDDSIAAADITGLNVGWFPLASAELETLKEVQPSGKTIVDRLYNSPRDEDGVSVGSFGILIQLLRMTGLLEVLRSSGSFTLLAPTDDAFAALPEGVARDLVKYSSRDKLASILEYHIYPDKELLKQIGDNPTVQGELITWDKTTDPVTANDASVLFVDLEASNGVVHIIDTVLFPKNAGAGALKGLVEPVDLDDIDYTTQRIRATIREYEMGRVKELEAAHQRHEVAINELTAGVRATMAMGQQNLARTQQYNVLAEDPKRSDAAVALAKEISLENDKFDINLIRLNELKMIADESDELTARIKALAARLRQTSQVKQGQ